MGSSQTRARTRVPCIGRRILNHCATREAPFHLFLNRFRHLTVSFFCISAFIYLTGKWVCRILLQGARVRCRTTPSQLREKCRARGAPVPALPPHCPLLSPEAAQTSFMDWWPLLSWRQATASKVSPTLVFSLSWGLDAWVPRRGAGTCWRGDLHRLLGKQLSEELSAQRSALLANRISPEPGAWGG